MAFNKDQIVSIYRNRAKRYDLSANLYYLLGFREYHYRRMGVAALELEPGDTVVEIGCGTGLNFPLIQEAVGSEGKIIGVDFTDAMLEKARQRVLQQGWANVELVHCDAAEFDFPQDVGGIISTFALTLVPEYETVVKRGGAALALGKHLVVLDFKLPGGFLSWLAPLLALLYRPFAVTLDLAERHPWEAVQKHLDQSEIRNLYGGFAYLARGVGREKIAESEFKQDK